MGGTSCDVGVIRRRPFTDATDEFEWGIPSPSRRRPDDDRRGRQLDRAARPGRAAEVGPESAGADPGPAAYGHGGTRGDGHRCQPRPGSADPDYFLGGELTLDPTSPGARSSRSRRGSAAGSRRRRSRSSRSRPRTWRTRSACLPPTAASTTAASSSRPLAARAAPRVGARPRIGLAGVIIPPSPGLASAFGALAADLRADRRLTRLFRSDRSTDAELRQGLEQVAAEALDELRRRGRGALPSPLSVSCRYLGQNSEQDVAVAARGRRSRARAARARFHEAHRATYGYRIERHRRRVRRPERDRHRGPGRTLPQSAAPQGTLGPSRRRPPGLLQGATAGSRRRSSAARSCRRGAALEGPAVIEEVDSTTLVLRGQVARVQAAGHLLLDALEAARARAHRDGGGNAWLTPSGSRSCTPSSSTSARRWRSR